MQCVVSLQMPGHWCTEEGQFGHSEWDAPLGNGDVCEDHRVYVHRGPHRMPSLERKTETCTGRVARRASPQLEARKRQLSRCCARTVPRGLRCLASSEGFVLDFADAIALQCTS